MKQHKHKHRWHGYLNGFDWCTTCGTLLLKDVWGKRYFLKPKNFKR
jgi:hypothetical protein